MFKLFIVIITLFSASANAALIKRNDGLIYDDVLNITWLKDANLASSTQFGVAPMFDGNMSWGAAQDWIANMNAANYLGFSDWRLPTMLNTDSSCIDDGSGFYRYTCTSDTVDSELGHLFYNALGGMLYSDINALHNESYNLFHNIQSYKYWTESGALYGWCGNGFCYSYAWYFDFYRGTHGQSFKANMAYVWPVRNGDVNLIMEPSTAILLTVGLILIYSARRALGQPKQLFGRIIST